MHKKLIALAVLAAGAFIATGAQAKDVSGWFINGGVGSAHYGANYQGVSGSESDTAFQFTGGWRSQFIGLEAGYVNLGSISEHDDFGDSAHISGKGWTVGVNGHFNPTEKWYISARAGLFRWQISAHATLVDNDEGEGIGPEASTEYVSSSAGGWKGYAGVGTGVDFNHHWSLGGNFDYYQLGKQGINIHAKVYSVNLEYRF